MKCFTCRAEVGSVGVYRNHAICSHCQYLLVKDAAFSEGMFTPPKLPPVPESVADAVELPKSLRGVTLAIDRQTIDALTIRVVQLENENTKLAKERDEARERRKWFDLMWRAAESRANLAEHNHETAAKQRSEAWNEIEELKLKVKP